MALNVSPTSNLILLTLPLLLLPLLDAAAVVGVPSSTSSSSSSSLAFSQPRSISVRSSSGASPCCSLRRSNTDNHHHHRRQLLTLPPVLRSRTTATSAGIRVVVSDAVTAPTVTNTASALHMSCIPDDNDSNTENNISNNKRSNINKDDDDDNRNTFLFPFNINLNLLPKINTQLFSLPPPPEDPIALSGDIVALFVYSYMDHTVNEMYAQLSTKMDSSSISASISTSSAAVEFMDMSTTAIDSNVLPAATTATIAAAATTAGGIIQQPLPVWFDTTHLQTFGSNWLAITHIDTPYAPAIASSGLAFVCIATSWLLCGYISGAFLHRNTIECNPTQAMIITFQTWMGTALLMILLALGSDKLWSALDTINALSPQARGGLTKADADYIFDSLSVLGFWRFMLNWFLGYR